MVIYSRMQCARNIEEVIEHLLAVEQRASDVIKIVTTVNTPEELAEAFKTTMTLKQELKTPFIHLCNGAFSRPHHFMRPVLGTSIFFAVSHYHFPDLFIKKTNSILDNAQQPLYNHSVTSV